MDELFDLTGRVAVVTGAARGLGQACAIGLARFGADAALVDLSAESCGRTLQQVAGLGRQGRAYTCDVSDQEQVARTTERIHSDFGRIDILVNNAGIPARIPTVDMPPRTVRELTDVNYLSQYWFCQAAGRIMIDQAAGSIINMSALGGGLLGMGRGNAAYCATKGAIVALTRDLACEWGPKGVRVNALAPYWFRTDMNATSIFANERFMEQVLTKIPIKRIGQPPDVVGPLVFLASDAAALITGLVLPVDGGAAATCPIEWAE